MKKTVILSVSVLITVVTVLVACFLAVAWLVYGLIPWGLAVPLGLGSLILSAVSLAVAILNG